MAALTIEINCLKVKLEEERKLRLLQDLSQVIHLNSFFKNVHTQFTQVQMATHAYEIHVSHLTGSGRVFVIHTHRTIVVISSGRTDREEQSS